MSELKSAFDLASSRVIASRNKKEEEKERTGFDFIEIPEFSDRGDKVIEIPGYTDRQDKVGTNESKFIDGSEDVAEDTNIEVKEYTPIHYDDNLIEVCWSGHFMDFGGFARLNRTMAFGLSNRNVKVKIESEPYLNHVNQSTRKQLEFFANVELSPNAPKVFGSTVPLNMANNGRKILYTMIETSEKVHKDYSEKINLMNEVWVATKYGKKIMENSGVHVPIYVMPLGVDIDRYKPDCGTMSFGKAMRQFKFVSVFRWSYRKGFDILLRAYMEEFSGDEDVSLLLVSRALECPEENGVEKILEDFNGIRAGINRPEEDMPHIALYTKPIHEKDMPKVYNSCNAFTLISRGEGFGLPYIEAGATGIPVIASNCSGHTDFLNSDNSYLVDPEGYVEATLSGRMSRMAKLCHFYEGQMFPHFGADAVKKTREHMRFVYENYSEAKEKAENLRKSIVNNYTWDMAIDKVYNRLRELQG